jgi:chromosomal replication initiation ATPase DnaA
MYFATTSTMPAAGFLPMPTDLATLTAGTPEDTMGMHFSVLQYPTEFVNTTPQRMLHVIALALDMNPECYRMKTRVRNIVELRFIGSLFLRRHFPALTLHQIAAYFGGQDHSSVINGLSRAHALIYTRNSDFVRKYNTAVKSVNKWLRKGA